MKVHATLTSLLISASSINVDAQITTYPCPSAGQQSILPLSSIDTTPTTIRIPIISASDGVCILTRRNISTQTQRAPLARSYSGYNWGQSSGVFAKTGSGVLVDCSTPSGPECDVTVPPLLDGMEYILESYTHTLSEEAEAARFLEQATFGATRESIDAMTSTSNDFSSWVEEQLQLPVSSHRSFFREHTNPKFEYPYKVGATGSRPCEMYSRWRRYALTSRDQLRARKTGQLKQLTVESVNGNYVWRVDGHFRTVTAEAQFTDGSSIELGERYSILHDHGKSWVADCVGCEITVLCQTCANTDERYLFNPPISVEGIEGTSILPYNVVSLPNFKSNQLPTIESSDEYPMFAPWIKPFEHALLNTTLDENECVGFPSFREPFPQNEDGFIPGTFPAVFGRSIDENSLEEVIFAYDPHLKFYENTIENPLMDGGGQMVMDTNNIPSRMDGGSNRIMSAGTQVICQNVEQNFQNQDHCKLSYLPNVCSPREKPKSVIVIDETNLAGINSMMNTKLFAVTGLSIEDPSPLDTVGDAILTSPCSSSTSRWVKDEGDTVCANSANIGSQTMKTFADLISGATIKDEDYNPSVIKVQRSIRGCDDEDTSKLAMGAVRTGDGTCWKHVHISEKDVIDFGNADISKYTKTGSVTVTINDMDWFYSVVNQDEVTYPVIGKLDEHVSYSNALAPLNDDAVKAAYGTLDYNPSEGPVLVCGSPNEVASDPFNSEHGFDVTVPEIHGFRSMSIWELSAQRHTTWEHLAMHAADQLRQKMAWSLSQIVAVGLPGSGMVFNEETEHYIAFYDLFVNYGFGNYLDLMKEFSYNYIMGGWLSFIGNKSLQHNIDELGKNNYPDENYAREIMQLFSVGLYSLNMDGSEILDENGFPKETYTIDDIMSYARGWTGFESRGERGGVSTGERQVNDKSIDPMSLNLDNRDKFPKSNLANGYIGDHVALCEDLPKKHFLRKGATFRALGSKPIPLMHEDKNDWYENPDFKRLQVLPSSPLYNKLCAADANGVCTSPSHVVLAENLIYDAAAQLGDEYQVDTIRTVALYVGSSKPIYYEYIRQPCVELAFFNDAKKVINDQVWPSDRIIAPSLCGNPKLEIAKTLCMSSDLDDGKVRCTYQGERVRYATAEAVCAAEGRVLGQPVSLKEPRAGDCANGMNADKFKMWTSAWCKVQVKIDMASGYTAIVNEVQPDLSDNATADVNSLVSPDTLNFFKTYWSSGLYPASLNECLALSSCHVHDDHCICDTDTSAMESFYGATSEIISIDQLMSSLPLGAVDPDTQDTGVYTNLGSCNIPGDDVTVYSKSGDCSTLAADTIFGFEKQNKQYFLMNTKSTVHIVGSDYSFRNPVSFTNLADSAVRDMHYETDSILESLFYHPSHPPFMASRLIQRFGVSNPSPGFIERVATAYMTGSYDNGRFGSGKYGDLSALAAAILLDTETRQVALDADPINGHIREPLVKVLSFFRSQGVSYMSPLGVPTLLNTEDKIGQGSFESPGVFSFFLPEFIPSSGPAQSAGLVAPEAMILDGDNTLDLLDSIFSVVKFGVSPCYNPTLDRNRGTLPGFGCASSEGDTSKSIAVPSYFPPPSASVDDILDELDILLTSGRLTDKNRVLIKSHVSLVFDTGDVAKAVRVAQELIFASPEFHSTGLTSNLGEKREVVGYEDPPTASYKAIVLLMMRGGADSFNLLVPVGDCSISDQYAEYTSVRGGNALPLANITTLDATSSPQDCNTFGVNKEFDYLSNLYNDGDALFLANTGILTTQSTKYDDWGTDQRVQLFAHNSMVHEFYRGDPLDVNTNTGVFGRMLDKLKLQGYQTSANSRGAGDQMLAGDQQYKNPIWGVSTSAPSDLNQDPTVLDIYEVVKELNGVGTPTSGVMSETWSSRVAAALFEHEQMKLIATMDEFDVESYGEGDLALGGSSLGSSFKAIIEYMKSRHFRKVNREVYVLSQDGYDNHDKNAVSDLFSQANDAIEDFVFELKQQGLWDNTVIVMGSDFGRSLNPNSNGGTDHAWGGNYFMAGGSVKGGQVLGRYPQPLGPDNDYWIGRGRFIPTTPWDSVWNGIANWMGVQDDDDLDWILPNRQSFDKCDLYHDTDLFKYGGCTCTQCSPVTDSPTPVPPTSLSPVTFKPTLFPTNSPIPAPPEGGMEISNILEVGSTFSDAFGGCSTSAYRTIDKTTEKYACDRPGGSVSGFTVTPASGKMSVVKQFRLYAHNNCPDCDVVAYILEGRVDTSSPWNEIGSGDLPWKFESIGRNSRGLPVISTFESGDTNLVFTHVSYPANTESYSEYRISFTETRDPTNPTLYISEMELAGYLFENPTQAPTTAVPTTTLTTVSPVTALPTSPLLPLEYIGNGFTNGHYGQCQGDCDRDSDCMSGLQCFQRSNYDVVPGCSGAHLNLKDDFCWLRPTNYLWVTGNNGSPASAFPLGACDGDCDSDGDCNIGLLCLIRSGDEMVPGCDGPGVSGQDYCYDPSPISQTSIPSKNPTNEPTPNPTPVPTANPSKNPTNEPTPNPTPIPTANPSKNPTNEPTPNPTPVPTANPSKNPTNEPTPNPTPVPTANPSKNPTNEPTPNPTPVPTANPSKNPTNEPTPSPTPIPTANPSKNPTDEPTTLEPTIPEPEETPSPSNPATVTGIPLQDVFTGQGDPPSPLSECAGDCDNDSQCEWPLRCFLRSSSEEVPGCLGSGISGKDYCWRRPTENTYWLMGNNGQPADAFPLGHCEADCDGDQDCATGLLCFQRGGDEPVPGCIGSADRGEDYCYDPDFNSTPPPTLPPVPATPSPITPAPITPAPITPVPTDAPVTSKPTNSPVTQIPTSTQLSGEFTNTIFDTESSVESVACSASNSRAFDQTTEKWFCGMDASSAEASGIIISPSHGLMSIAKKLRVYTANNCPDCDPISYIVSGRVDISSSWVQISAGDLPDFPGRNNRGLPIISTYENADPDRASVQVDLSSNTESFFDYKLQFPATRGSTTIQASEIELPGWLIHSSPTLSPTESPIAGSPAGGVEISNILEVGSTFSDGFGGCSTSASRAIDKTTGKYACDRPGGPGGFTVTPASGKMSVVKQFRLYAHNNCGGCDVVAYILEGRVNTSSPWNEIGSGDLPWKSTGAGRNARGLSIVSTFESGDTNLVFTHVSYPTNVASYSEYRVSFTETRKPTSSVLQFSELELAGYILD